MKNYQCSHRTTLNPFMSLQGCQTCQFQGIGWVDCTSTIPYPTRTPCGPLATPWRILRALKELSLISSFLTGLSDLPVPGDWGWVDCTSPTPYQDSLWAPGYPMENSKSPYPLLLLSLTIFNLLLSYRFIRLDSSRGLGMGGLFFYHPLPGLPVGP